MKRVNSQGIDRILTLKTVDLPGQSQIAPRSPGLSKKPKTREEDRQEHTLAWLIAPETPTYFV